MSSDDSFSPLEKAILDWFGQSFPNTTLSHQIDSATFLSRKWTKVGFFVDFNVPRDLSPIELSEFGGRWPIDGPRLTSSGIKDDGGSLLWGGKGYVTHLEMYAYGDYFAESIDDFELS